MPERDRDDAPPATFDPKKEQNMNLRKFHIPLPGRRAALGAFAALGLFIASFFAGSLWAPPASAGPQAAEALIVDPADPVGGNPKGDVTIVEFSDYNCPYCKSASAELEKLVREDSGIRLVYKDWPILTDASAYGARLALAAARQGKYEAVHAALMAIPGMRISKDRMLEAVKGSGVDMARLEADLKEHGQDIDAVLERNASQAEALGIQGTPAFLIGPYLAASALDLDGFRQAVKKARARSES